MKYHGITMAIAVLLLGILALWLVSALLFGAGVAIAFVLLLLIKVLFAVFVIGLVVGLAVYVKNNILTKEDIETMKNSIKDNGAIPAKGTCAACGKELEASWKICPYCGEEKEVRQAEV